MFSSRMTGDAGLVRHQAQDEVLVRARDQDREKAWKGAVAPGTSSPLRDLGWVREGWLTSAQGAVARRGSLWSASPAGWLRTSLNRGTAKHGTRSDQSFEKIVVFSNVQFRWEIASSTTSMRRCCKSTRTWLRLWTRRSKTSMARSHLQ